jgi:hypothetical protein
LLSSTNNERNQSVVYHFILRLKSFPYVLETQN